MSKHNESLIVTVSVNGVANRTVWSSEEPFQVGFPVRWVMERSSKGVVVRHFTGEDESAKDSEIRELNGDSLAKGVEVELPFSGRQKSPFKVELKAVETLPPAYETHDGEFGELRIYACRGDWTSESIAFEDGYTGLVENRKAFKIARHGNEYVIKSLVSDLQVGRESLDKGSELRLSARQLVGKVLSVGEFEWRIESQKKGDDDKKIALIPLLLDEETLVFRKALKAAGAGIVALALLALIWPKPQQEEPKPETIAHLQLKKPTHVTAAANGGSPYRDRINGGGGSHVAAHENSHKSASGHASASHKSVAKASSHQAQHVAKAHAAPAKPAKAKSAAKAVAQAHAQKKVIVAKQVAQPVTAPRARPTQPAPRLVTPKGQFPIASARASRKAKPVETHNERNTQLAKLMGDAGFRSAAKGLTGGGMTQLLANSRYAGGGDARAEAKHLLDSGEGAIGTGGIGGSAGSMGTGNVQVATLGGDGSGDGEGNGGSGYGGNGGVGYGRGSHARVNGQGTSMVSLDTGNSDVEEGLTRDQVGRVIHAHMSEIRYCYESAKLHSPELEGKLSVAFTVAAPGSVSRAGVGSSTVDGRLNDCVLKRLVTWKFPRPKGGVNVAVNYPFIFKTLGR